MLSFTEAESVITEAMKYRNYTLASIESYRQHLKMFDIYLRHKGVPDYREVKEKDYYDFLDYVERKADMASSGKHWESMGSRSRGFLPCWKRRRRSFKVLSPASRR